MSEPTPIKRRRSYTKRRQAEVVGLSEVVGVRAAARKAHVPVSTLENWRLREDMAQLRTQKKEDVAADVWAAFQAGVRRIVELIPQTEDMSKVAVATGILFDKFALMSGEATSRTESKTLTDGMNDHERETLRHILDGVAVEVEA